MRENLELNALISKTAIRQELNSWLLATTTTTKQQKHKLESSLLSIFILKFLHAPTHVTTYNFSIAYTRCCEVLTGKISGSVKVLSPLVSPYKKSLQAGDK
jgi:hypothetical protein